MRVVHVIWHLDIGGGEVFLRGLTQALVGRGIEQHVLTVGPAGRLAREVEAQGIRVTPLRKSSKAGIVTIGRMAQHLRRLAPDVVHTHGEAGVFWGLPAARLAGARAVSLIYQNADEHLVKMVAERTMLRLPSMVVAGSRDVARFARERLDVSDRRLRTIYCGIAASAPAAASAGAVRTPGAHPAIVAVGRLVPRKGHATLVDAFAIVRREQPAARLVIAGDGPERTRLDALVRARGLADAVALPGTVYPTGGLLAEADVFVFPSLAEPQGLALLEAFAAGVPVVASRTGGIPEMLRDGEDGLLVPPGDANALAAGLLRMITDPDLRRRSTAHARRCLARFDLHAIADEYVDLYRTVARGRA